MTRPLALFVTGMVVAVLLYGLSLALARDVREPNYEILPADMVRQPAFKTGELCDVLPGGIEEQAPPEGTIPYGLPPWPYGPGEEEMQRAGRELQNPFATDDAALERGRHVFTEYCAVCHGLGGKGDAPITQRGFPPPPPLQRPESRALADGEIFHIITYGRKNMPSAAALVDRDDRWKVIRYVRTLQEAE